MNTYKKVKYIKTVVNAVLAISLFFVTAVFAQSSAVRSIDNDGAGIKRVNIAINPPEGIASYDISENIPEGVTPFFISNDGTWDSHTRKITWNTNGNALTYYIIANAGSHTLSGTVSFNDGAGNIITEPVEGVHEIVFDIDGYAYDSDNDGLSNYDEVSQYLTNPKQHDSDYDGLSDGQEINTYNTNPNINDSDNDKLTDGSEVLIYHTNPSSSDSDNDSLSDFEETVYYNTNPNEVDHSIRRVSYYDGWYGFLEIDVEINVNAPEGTTECAVIENIPKDMHPFDISSNGLWDEVNRKITWDNFNWSAGNKATYKLSAFKGTYYLSGETRFGETGVTTVGDKQVSLNNEMLSFAPAGEVSHSVSFLEVNQWHTVKAKYYGNVYYAILAISDPSRSNFIAMQWWAHNNGVKTFMQGNANNPNTRQYPPNDENFIPYLEAQVVSVKNIIYNRRMIGKEVEWRFKITPDSQGNYWMPETNKMSFGVFVYSTDNFDDGYNFDNSNLPYVSDLNKSYVYQKVNNNNSAKPAVTIHIKPGLSVKCFAVEANIPAGLIPQEISANGVWNEDKGKVLWGPLYDNAELELSYKLAGLRGSYTLNGTASFDGENISFTGNTEAVVFVAFIHNISVTRSIYGADWNSYYKEIDNYNSRVVISLVRNVVAGKFYIEETLPEGIIPLNISQIEKTPVGGGIYVDWPASLNSNKYGVWDSSKKTITWGPFEGDNDVTLRYDVDGAYGSYMLNGKCKFNRKDIDIAGDNTLAIKYIAVRKVYENYTATPNILITLPETKTGYEYYYEEYLPKFLEPIEINNDGIWNEQTRTITWGPYRDTELRQLSYKVNGYPSYFPLSGRFFYDNDSSGTLGDTDVSTKYQSSLFSAPSNGISHSIDSLTVNQWHKVKAKYYGNLWYAVLAISNPSRSNFLGMQMWRNGNIQTFVQKNVLDTTTRDYSKSDYLVARVASLKSIMENNRVVGTEIEWEFKLIPDNEGKYWFASNQNICFGVFMHGTLGTISFYDDGYNFDQSNLTYPNGVQSQSEIVQEVLDNETSTPILNVNITPSYLTHYYCVEVNIPAGLAPFNINEGGVWDSSSAKIKWGPFYDTAERDFNYKLGGFSGNYKISGVASFNGENISFENTISVISQNPSISRGIEFNNSMSPLVQIIPVINGEGFQSAIYENIPSGVTPSNISGGGIWDSQTRKITWGSFNSPFNEVLTYRLNGDLGNYQLSGGLIVNDVTIDTVGSYEITVSNQASAYYVSPNGDNANNGSFSSPWKTIQYGVEHIQGGDTLIVKEGFYVENGGIKINNQTTPNISGTEGNPTTIQAQGKVYLYKTSIIVQGTESQPIQYLAINGFNVGDINTASSYPHGMMFEYTKNISLSNNSVYRYAYGVTFRNSDSCNISLNKCLYNSYGITLESSSNSNIKDNICNYNRRGIIVSSGYNNIITNNICNNNYTRASAQRESAGIGIYCSSTDCIITENLLSNNSGHIADYVTWYGAGIYISGNSSDSIVTNNRLLKNGLYFESDNILNKISATNNIFYESALTFRSSIMFNDEKIISLKNNVFYYSQNTYTHFNNNIRHTDIDYHQPHWSNFSYPIYIQNYVRYGGYNAGIIGGFNARNITFENNIFYATQNYNPLMQFDNDSYEAQDIDYNCFTNNIVSIANIDCEGQNNIMSTDPYFRNAESNNFQLLPNSPCLSSGKNGIAMGIYSGDYAFLDSDCDGMPDYFEDKYSLDNSIQDDSIDSDCDGLSNYYELFWNLNPKDNDTDNDGLTDGSELYTNPLLEDSDFDMLSDYEELYVYHTDPMKHDSDGDGIIDGEEVKGWINSPNSYITNPLKKDSDGDGVNDGTEKELSTNPLSSDTDGDRSKDSDEIYAGTDPNNPQSVFKVATIEPIYENGTFIAFKITWKCSSDTSLNLSYKIKYKKGDGGWGNLQILPEDIIDNPDGTKSYIDYDPDMQDYNIITLIKLYAVTVHRD